MAVEVHVVMFPWSAFGHIMPFFQLSIALAKAGVRVSFVQTPKNIERLPSVPSSLASLINFVAIPMPELENGDLPKGAEATVDVPLEKMPHLSTAYCLLRYPFRKFVADQSPDWIFIDFASHWVVDIAHELKVPVIFFSVLSAAANAFVWGVRPSMDSLMSPPKGVDFPSLVTFKKHEAIRYFNDHFTVSNGKERIGRDLSKCDAICIRTSEEFEGPYMDLLRKSTSVIPTGLLPPDKPEGNNLTDESCKKIFKWLDEQKPKSVVFVGFGSECKLSKDQVHEIAYGLELAELPFLWSLRKPDWANEEIETLPPGFGARTRGKGVVHMGWAPQMEILGHPSIGGSLFHSGWGSVIETLQFGHCLVLLPFIYDQGLNARLLVEKGLAVEIDRADDGSFSREDIAKGLRLAMVLEEGEPLRVRAREAAAVIEDRKLQEHYTDELIKFLKSQKPK